MSSPVAHISTLSHTPSPSLSSFTSAGQTSHASGVPSPSVSIASSPARHISILSHTLSPSASFGALAGHTSHASGTPSKS